MNEDQIQLVTEALRKMGIRTQEFQKEICLFAEKVDILLNTNRYDYLRKRISIGWTDMEKLAGDAFEIHFSCAFENKQKPLNPAVKLLPDSNSDVDFQYQASSGKVINFELVNIFERQWIRREMDKGDWEISLSSDSQVKKEDPRAESIFVQQKIREKVQRKQNQDIVPFKFNVPAPNEINVIVANVTFVRFGHFDKDDCIEVILGSRYVEEPFNRRGIFGMTDDLPCAIPDPDLFKLKEAYQLNEIFCNRIHFVLFAWDIHKSKRFIDSQYQYSFAPNLKLVSQETFDLFKREMEAVFTQ